MRYFPEAKGRWKLTKAEGRRWKDTLFERWGQDLVVLYRNQPLVGSDGQELPVVTWEALKRLVWEMEKASRTGRRWLAARVEVTKP